MDERVPFVALDDGGIEIQGGPADRGLAGRPPHEDRVDRRQRFQLPRLFRNPGHPGRGPARELGLVVKGAQEIVQGIGRWQRPGQEPAQARVPGEDPDVFHAVAPGRLHQHQGMDLVEFVVAALPLPQLQALADHLVEAQGQHCLRDQGQTRERRQIHRLHRGFEDERQDPLVHPGQAPRTTGAYDTAGRPGVSPDLFHPMGARFLASGAALTGLERNQGLSRAVAHGRGGRYTQESGGGD